MAPTASIPKGVQEQAAAADAKLAAINQGTPIPPSGTPAPTPGAPTASIVESAESQTPEETAKRLSQALVVLQGKYNAEVPHLMKENSQLKKELEITQADRERADAWGVEPEEIAGFKADILDTVEQRRSGPTQDPKRSTYIQTLDALVGGEELRKATVKDPAFNQFLDMIDSTTGRVIRDIAEEADSSNNAGRMVEIYQSFSQWKNSQAGTHAKPGHLMPNAQRGGDTDLRSGRKPIYTKTQYEAFQQRVKRGDFRTLGKHPAVAEKIQAEYNAWSDEFASAMREGRIQG
jgi:hypothetical protein